MSEKTVSVEMTKTEHELWKLSRWTTEDLSPAINTEVALALAVREVSKGLESYLWQKVRPESPETENVEGCVAFASGILLLAWKKLRDENAWPEVSNGP